MCDNYATHKHPTVKAWLARNPRITLHFTPTSGSWLNLVEIFFGIITRQAIRRGTFSSVRELIDAITAFIDGWNERCEPFVWTKDADTIIAKAHRKSTSATRHWLTCRNRGMPCRGRVSSQGVPPVDHAIWGGIQGLADRASRMASMGRRPWLRALTR